MIFRNRILFVCFGLVCLAALIFQWVRHQRPQAEQESHTQASAPVMQVLLKHKPRDCRCPDWEVVKAGDDKKGSLKGSLIFIEAASPIMALSPESLAQADNGYLIQLHGELDAEKRFPAGFPDTTASHAEKAPVFVYTTGEFIKQE